MSNNEKTISFRALAEKIDALDALAAAQDRSRSYLINEAITNYIELHAYQDAQVPIPSEATPRPSNHSRDLSSSRLIASRTSATTRAQRQRGRNAKRPNFAPALNVNRSGLHPNSVNQVQPVAKSLVIDIHVLSHHSTT